MKQITNKGKKFANYFSVMKYAYPNTRSIESGRADFLAFLQVFAHIFDVELLSVFGRIKKDFHNSNSEVLTVNILSLLIKSKIDSRQCLYS